MSVAYAVPAAPSEPTLEERVHAFLANLDRVDRLILAVRLGWGVGNGFENYDEEFATENAEETLRMLCAAQNLDERQVRERISALALTSAYLIRDLHLEEMRSRQ